MYCVCRRLTRLACIQGQCKSLHSRNNLWLACITNFGPLIMLSAQCAAEECIICGAGTGVEVRLAVRNPATRVVLQTAPVTLHIVAAYLSADTDMRVKLLQCRGHSARCPCMHCNLSCTLMYSKQRLAGYLTPVGCRGAPHAQLLMGDPGHRSENQRLRSEQDVLHCARQAQEAADDFGVESEQHARAADEHGMRGGSMVIHMLWYLRYLDAFLVCFAHAFYRGVWRKFLICLLQTPAALRKGKPANVEGLPEPRLPAMYAFSSQARGIIAQRGHDFVGTQVMSLFAYICC